jgi:diaminopimelate decarboxylase
MNHFDYREGVLHAEDVDLERLAAEVGTPAYVYSTATLVRHVRVFREAFAPLQIGLYFAMKANGNLSVLATLAREGAGADTVSEGEVRKSLAAGIPADRIVLSGVGKTEEELAFAVDAGIHQINVETAGELDLLDRIAQARGKRAPIVFRVNPAVGAGGHAKITTGSEHNKFGIGLNDIETLYTRAESMKGVHPLGLAVHIGSQIMDVAPLADAFARLRALTEQLRAKGHRIERLDLGGGLGVVYDDPAGMAEGPQRIEAYANIVKQAMAGLDVEIALEPGRIIVANAGIMIARVIGFNERRDGRVFAVLDAGMNDLLRPAMYESHHEIRRVRAPAPGTAPRRYDVVGPICESSDSFATDRELPELKIGDLVAFLSAGAYGATMSSTYNMRRLLPEVLVEGGRYAVVRPRQSFEELIGLDRMAPWLTNRS